MQQLKCAQAQCNDNLRIEPGVGLGEKTTYLLIELNLPTQNAQHQGGGEMAIGRGEIGDGVTAEQIV